MVRSLQKRKGKGKRRMKMKRAATSIKGKKMKGASTKSMEEDEREVERVTKKRSPLSIRQKRAPGSSIGRKKKSAGVYQKEESSSEDDGCFDLKRAVESYKRERSQLSACQKRADCHKRISKGHNWRAPRSPFELIQEDHCHDPWRILVICILLNVTTRHQVKNGVLSELFNKYPNAEAAKNPCEKDLVELLRPLGIYNRRASRFKKLSEKYLQSEWTHVTQLPGVGKYAADAYAIFCVGKPEEVRPRDHMFVIYWNWLLEERAREQQI